MFSSRQGKSELEFGIHGNGKRRERVKRKKWNTSRTIKELDNNNNYYIQINQKRNIFYFIFYFNSV